MKAAILVEQRKPLIVDQIELPPTLEVGQVLVKVHYSGICGSQPGEIDGAKGEDKFLQHLLGHETSGTVIDAFIENTGQTAVIEMGYGIANQQGRVILVGVPRKEKNVNIFSLPLHFGKGLSGSHGGEAIPQTDIPRYNQLFHNGCIQLKNLIK